MHTATYCLQSGTFRNILEHSACILEHSRTFWMHSGTFWNILEHSGTFWNILEHTGTYWNILDVVEGCRKVDFQFDQGRTDGQTHRQTLGLVELRLQAKN